jgi:hypothetical protein
MLDHMPDPWFEDRSSGFLRFAESCESICCWLKQSQPTGWCLLKLLASAGARRYDIDYIGEPSSGPEF